MSELGEAIRDYLETLARENASGAHGAELCGGPAAV